MCVDGENAHEVYIHGIDGGLCWGDSGGPVLEEGTSRVFGVLSRHAPRSGTYSCENGNRMIMTAGRLIATSSRHMRQMHSSPIPSPAEP